MISLYINIDGVNEADLYLLRMTARTQDFTPVMQDFGGHMRRSIMKNFGQGGRPKPWRPSKRVSLGGRGKTLQDTGQLKSSITYRATTRSLTVGTNLKYAAIHQFGGPAKDTLILPKKGKALKIMAHGSTLIDISPKTGRALTKRGKTGFRFLRAVTLKKGAIPARPFLIFHDEDIQYFYRRLRAYVTGGREGLK